MLDIEHNVLTGALPVQYSNLGSMANINVRYNHLTGSIPSEWSTGMPSLASFAADVNFLTGRCG